MSNTKKIHKESKEKYEISYNHNNNFNISQTNLNNCDIAPRRNISKPKTTYILPSKNFEEDSQNKISNLTNDNSVNNFIKHTSSINKINREKSHIYEPNFNQKTKNKNNSLFYSTIKDLSSQNIINSKNNKIKNISLSMKENSVMININSKKYDSNKNIIKTTAFKDFKNKKIKGNGFFSFLINCFCN